MKWLGGCLLLCLLGWASAAAAQSAETWLVAIGNNDGDGAEETLLYAERDANEVAAAFRTYGGVSGRRTTLLLGEHVDEARRALLDANTKIREATAQGRPTALVVFYSGHADAEALHLDATHLGLEELRSLVASSPATVRILIVDACRSGAVTRVKGVTPAAPFAIALEDQSSAEGFVIITSSAAGESSQESDVLRGSFFSHHLVNALRGAADRDADGLVTLNEAYAYAYAQTLASTGRTLALQHPTYAYDVKGRAPIVLARYQMAGLHTGNLKLGESATYLITPLGSSDVMAELTPDMAGAKVALPEGKYLVQQRFPTEYRQYRLSLMRGTEVDLTKQPFESARYDRLVRKRGGPRDLSHGFFALGGVHGTLLDEGATPQLVLGYNLDLPWSSIGVRARFGRNPLHYDDGVSTGSRDEWMGGMTFSRIVDLRWVSAGFGVLMEGGMYSQTRHGPNSNLERNAWGVNFGALASLERQLFSGFSLHLEGGPMTALFHRSNVQDGARTSDQVASVLTYWFAGGLIWRL